MATLAWLLRGFAWGIGVTLGERVTLHVLVSVRDRCSPIPRPYYKAWPHG